MVCPGPFLFPTSKASLGEPAASDSPGPLTLLQIWIKYLSVCMDNQAPKRRNHNHMENLHFDDGPIEDSLRTSA